MMFYICTKFHEKILNGIRVMERTRNINGQTDGQTDRWTDGRWARHNTTRLRRAYKKGLCKNRSKGKLRQHCPPDNKLIITLSEQRN